MSCIHADDKCNSLSHHSPQCSGNLMRAYREKNHLLRNAFCASRAMGDWSRNVLQPNCVPSSQAQASKLLYPVPYLSSTVPGTEMRQLKILVLQYQSIHSSLTGPNVLLITGSKNTVDLIQTVGHIISRFHTGLLRHTIRNLPSFIIFLYFVLLSIVSPLQAVKQFKATLRLLHTTMACFVIQNCNYK